jgi:osmotically inducible protein OsmC
MKPLYTATATTVGGRTGRSKSSDGILDLALATPKELGGPGGATNPEQLFAAGYSACFDSALRVVARLQKINLTSSQVQAQVTLNKTEQGTYALSAELHVELPELPQEAAQKLLEAAHQVCPYSVATRGNIPVKLVLARYAG